MVTIIQFHVKAIDVVRNQPCDPELIKKVSSSKYATNFDPAMILACRVIQDVGKKSQSSFILLYTDGEESIPYPDEGVNAIKSLKAEGYSNVKFLAIAE